MGTKHIIIVALVVLVILYWVHRHFKVECKMHFVKGPLQPVNDDPQPLNTNLVLQAGVTGPEVAQLQTWLGIPVTGAYDITTDNAIQNLFGVTGISLAQFQVYAPATQALPTPDDITNIQSQDQTFLSSNIAVGIA